MKKSFALKIMKFLYSKKAKKMLDHLLGHGYIISEIEEMAEAELKANKIVFNKKKV